MSMTEVQGKNYITSNYKSKKERKKERGTRHPQYLRKQDLEWHKLYVMNSLYCKWLFVLHITYITVHGDFMVLL